MVQKLPNPAKNKLVLPFHHRACELLIEGVSTDDIAEIIGREFRHKVSGRGVRHWFTDGHYVNTYYNDLVAQEIEAKKRITQHRFEAHVDKAQKALAEVMMGGNSMAKVEASKVFLDRGLGKVVEQSENLNMHVSFADWVKEQTLNENAERVSEESDPVV